MAKVTEEHLQARTRSILDACSRVFAKKGVASATVADIAAEAGLSAGAIYRYYRSKDELIEACFTEGSQQVAQEWELQFGATADPRQTFLEISANTFQELNLEEAGSRTRLMLELYLDACREDSDARRTIEDDRESIVHGLALGLQMMKGAGQLPADTDAPGLAAAFWSFWLGARITKLLDPGANTDSQLAALAALVTAAGGSEGTDVR